MPRVLHCGDLHVSDGPRFTDTLRCLDFIAETARTREADLVLVGGDMTGVTVPHVASPAERLSVGTWLQALADVAPTVVIRGNHDAESDLLIYGRLRARHPIMVTERPHVICGEGWPAAVFCLPYPRKNWLLAGGAGGNIESQKSTAEQGLRAILTAWRLQAAAFRARGIPIVGLMHLNIGGSRVGGGEVLIGQEIELSPHDLTELGLDYVALSHIHLRQQMAPNAWYAGSPSAQNHGEEGDAKGILLVEVEPGQAPVVVFIPTPARRLITVEATWTETEGWRLAVPVGAKDVAEAEVRLRVTVPEEARDVSEAWIATYEQQLREKMAAHAVVVERRIVPTTRVRSEAITTARTMAEKLAAFWQSLNSSGPSEVQRTRALERLGELETKGLA